MTLNNLFRIACCLVILPMVVACGQSHDQPKEASMVVTQEKSSSHLYYTGAIQPIKAMVVTSPVDGVVMETPFEYGQDVKKDKLLFVVSSTKFLTDYKSALMQYVKAKSDFNTNQTQLNESEFLHKNELISDDEYKMKKSNFYAAQLALVQAKDALDVFIKQLNTDTINLDNLSISNIENITKAMHISSDAENIQIFSPGDGIVLSPKKSNDDMVKTNKGDSIKQGDVVALIGDMSGISVKIKVNELTINQLKPGQHVKITGIAFPDDELSGTVSYADRQGESSSGGLPTFPVEVIVSHLTEDQQKRIHAGMSAKVELIIDEPPAINIPIQAIQYKDGLPGVIKATPKSNERTWVAVKTGKTTMDQVAILSGLVSGDTIVYTN